MTFAVKYSSDINSAYKQLEGRSRIIASPYGDIEYSEQGKGYPVLVVHGSGGGFDQGELIARTFLNERFHWIAPSRFGYLRSTYQEGATFDEQAHAYAHLLDQLKIKKVAVVALSHGGPSALLLAALYPERVSSLVLISAGVASIQTKHQAAAHTKGTLLVSIYKNDLLYWTMTSLFKKYFLQLMGADKDIVSKLTEEQRDLVHEVIKIMNPALPRSKGTQFDNKASMPNERITGIKAPTLLFHSKDDRLQLFQNAEYAAAKIPQANLVSFDRGGHLVMCTEQPIIREKLQAHILRHFEAQ